MDEKMTCAECGMPCDAGEYHPYAACLMFTACHNSATVRANLAHPAQAVDVGAIKTLLELVEDEHGGGHTEADCRHCVAVNKLTRAIGNAQAEGN